MVGSRRVAVGEKSIGLERDRAEDHPEDIAVGVLGAVVGQGIRRNEVAVDLADGDGAGRREARHRRFVWSGWGPGVHSSKDNGGESSGAAQAAAAAAEATEGRGGRER